MNDRDEEVRQAAVAARDFVRERIRDLELFVLSKKLDKYGRPLVIIWLSEEDFGDTSKSLNKELIDKGHGVPYMGEL
jgi:endonuclease YncB( thermonuclease family)